MFRLNGFVAICNLVLSKHFCKLVFLYAIVPLISFLVYYNYLNTLYIIDEIYNGDKLRELTIAEQFTLIVNKPDKFVYLKSFIEKYSICPSIYEIIVYTDNYDKLKSSDFTYSKTHSLVNFFNFSKSSSHIIKTEAVMLLDSSIDISCPDLAFMHSVWRSSKVVAVGILPRLHSKYSQNSDNIYLYLNGWYVWWYKKLSIVHSNALIMNTLDYQDIRKSPTVQSLLHDYPICESMIPSLWYNSKIRAAPIWAKVPYRVNSNVVTSKKFSLLNKTFDSNQLARYKADIILPDNAIGSCQQMTRCINMIRKSLNINYMPTTQYKSVRASQLLFW